MTRRQRWLDCIDEFSTFIKCYARALEEPNSPEQSQKQQKASEQKIPEQKAPEKNGLEKKVPEQKKPEQKKPRTFQPVKVALIDDGVDVTYKELSRIIADGETFCEPSGASGLYSSYYQSSGGHGTMMASLIRRVCPNVRLYVAKLDEEKTDVGEWSFTIKSAAEVYL